VGRAVGVQTFKHESRLSTPCNAGHLSVRSGFPWNRQDGVPLCPHRMSAAARG
jgi:hypothetical protein